MGLQVGARNGTTVRALNRAIRNATGIRNYGHASYSDFVERNTTNNGRSGLRIFAPIA